MQFRFFEVILVFWRKINPQKLEFLFILNFENLTNYTMIYKTSLIYIFRGAFTRKSSYKNAIAQILKH